VAYRAQLNTGQGIYEGPLKIEVENTQPFYHGPHGTHGSDASCSPGTAWTPVSAKFRIFAADHVYTVEAGAQVPCTGQGSFARGEMGASENWRADWSLGQDCVVVGNEAGTPGQGTAPTGTAFTNHGSHAPCSGSCANNFKVVYAEYLPVKGLAVGMGGPSSAFVGDTVTVTAGVAFDGIPVSGASVAFSVAGPAATAPAAFAGSTDGAGRAAFTFTAGVAGDYVVTASATSASHPGVTATGTHTVRFTPRPPPTLSLSGPPRGQTEENITTVATVAYDGRPAPGIPVRFAVASAGAGQATPPSGTAVTNAAGRASFTFTGNRAGDYTVNASAAETLTATHTVRLVIKEMTPAGAISMADDEDQFKSAVIDPAGRYAYFAEYDVQQNTKLVKVDLTTFQRVGAITLNAGEQVLSAVIDPAGRYAYLGAVSSDPGRVIKIDLDSFQRVGAITLDAGEANISSAVIDPAGRYAYFGTAGSPGRVVKIDLNTFKRVGAISLSQDPTDTAFKGAGPALMDPAGRYAYFAVYRGNYPALVIKVDLATFQQVGVIVMDDAERSLDSAVIDPTGQHAYFGSEGFLQDASIVKVDLDPFQRVDAIAVDLPYGIAVLPSAVIDPEGGYAYFGSTYAPDTSIAFSGEPVTPSPEQVVKVDLKAFALVTVLPLAGDGSLTSGVISPDGSHAYFGTSPRPPTVQGTPEQPTKVVRVALTRPPKAALAATGDAYGTGYAAPLSVPAPGVLVNDRDTGDGDPLSAGQASDPPHGSVALQPDGSFTYTPDSGFSGVDSFTYTATDGMDYSVPATVTVTWAGATVKAPPL